MGRKNMRVPIKRWGKLAFYVGLGAVAAVAAACQKDRTPEPVPEDAGHDTRQNDASGATVGSSQPIPSASVSTTVSASAAARCFFRPSTGQEAAEAQVRDGTRLGPALLRLRVSCIEPKWTEFRPLDGVNEGRRARSKGTSTERSERRLSVPAWGAARLRFDVARSGRRTCESVFRTRPSSWVDHTLRSSRKSSNRLPSMACASARGRSRSRSFSTPGRLALAAYREDGGFGATGGTGPSSAVNRDAPF